MDRKQFCILEPVAELRPDGDTVRGVFSLIQFDQFFQLHWVAIKGSPITAIFQSSHDYSKDDWTFAGEFCIYSRDVQFLALSEDPLAFTLTRPEKMSRTFCLNEIRFCELVNFFEILSLKGLAVPTMIAPYTLEFFGHARVRTYPYVPPTIQLSLPRFETLDSFWAALITMVEEFMVYLASEALIPRDYTYPLGSLSRACHLRRLESIEKLLPGDHLAPIGVAEWPNLFDAEGRLKDPEQFNNRLYYEGIDPSLLRKALPFILQMYPLDSTENERQELAREMVQEYKTIENQWKSFSAEQLASCKRRASAFRVIKHDVMRTDRQETAFKKLESIGLVIVQRVLTTYCLFNPAIGYLQGMNDLLVPILLAYFPHWDDDSRPIDETGELITNWEDYVPEIFWAYERLLHRTDHLPLLQDVTNHAKHISAQVELILQRLSPLVRAWMQRHGLMELHWYYSNFILMYKRSIPDIWPVWIQLLSSPEPDNWLSYLSGAVFLLVFDKLASEVDSSLTAIMDHLPGMIQCLAPRRLARVTRHIRDTMKDDEEFQLELAMAKRPPPPEPEPCEWFEPI
jgi:hypothetical protein